MEIRNANDFSCLFYFSCPDFWDISGPLSEVGEPQNRTSNIKERKSKSKRNTKNSILVSISENTAKNFLNRYARQKNISACISRNTLF